MNETAASPADALVIFGITGDLAAKMTFPTLYRLEAAGQIDCPIIGAARDDWSEDHLAVSMRQSLPGDPARSVRPGRGGVGRRRSATVDGGHR